MVHMQLASAEFTAFCKQWSIEHSTSSPHYPQNNGKAENAVKTVKNLFKKCKASGQSEYLALLDWRNTPSESMDTSPAQRLMGRRCKTLLPTTTALLQPRYDTDEDARVLLGQKEKQRYHYDKNARTLEPTVTCTLHLQLNKVSSQHMMSPACWPIYISAFKYGFHYILGNFHNTYISVLGNGPRHKNNI